MKSLKETVRVWWRLAVGASFRDSPNDALWDLDAIHGDEFLQLIQTGHILNLTAELGAATRAVETHAYKNKYGAKTGS